MPNTNSPDLAAIKPETEASVGIQAVIAGRTHSTVTELPIEPRRGFVARHIELLTGYNPETSICFRVLGDDEPKNLIGTLAECWPELERRNKAGAQLYLIVNEGGHSGAEITTIRSLFIDADGIPLPDHWHVEPDFLVIRNATHWHAYWLVMDMPLAGFTEAQHRLAAYYGSDPAVCDLPRVMRLAGSVHTKLKPEGDGVSRLVRITDVATRFVGLPAEELLTGLPAVQIRTKDQRRTAAKNVGNQVDRPGNVEKFNRYLTAYPIPEEGNGSDWGTYKAIARGFDFGLSDETIISIIEAATGFEPGWLEEKLENVWAYRQNDWGCDAELSIDRLSRRNGLAEPEEVAEPADPNWPFLYIRNRAARLSTPAPVMLVDTLIPDKRLTYIWGDQDAGKTYVLGEIAHAVATRRSAFGRFPVTKPGAAGNVVLFVAEDADYFEQSRLDALEQRYGEAANFYTVQDVPPLDDEATLQRYLDELDKLQEWTGLPIDLVGIDTLKRSLGGMKQKDGETAQLFTRMVEQSVIAKYACPVICTAHQPKSGAEAGISGAGDFMNNAPVSLHVIRSSQRPFMIEIAFEPKYRIGPRPDPFVIEGTAQKLSAPLPSGVSSDLIFTATGKKPARVVPDWQPRFQAVYDQYEAWDEAHALNTQTMIETLAECECRGWEDDPGYSNKISVARNDWRAKLDNGCRPRKGKGDNPSPAQYRGWFSQIAEGDKNRPVWWHPRQAGSGQEDTVEIPF